MLGLTMNENRLIRCRARIDDYCLHGSFDDPDNPWQEDGTYDRPTNTIICDSCFCTLMPYTPSGQALNHELPDAIRNVRRLNEVAP